MTPTQNLESMVESPVSTVTEISLDPATKSYDRYQKLGGIINQEDYLDALERARNATTFNRYSAAQAEDIAEKVGIVLKNSQGASDPRVILYAVMRQDHKPEAKYHHGQMNDQRLFGEVLRMLEDAESLQKLKRAYRNIHFD